MYSASFRLVISNRLGSVISYLDPTKDSEVDDTLPSLEELLQTHFGKRAESEASALEADPQQTVESAHQITHNHMEETQSISSNDDQRGNSQGKLTKSLMLQ